MGFRKVAGRPNGCEKCTRETKVPPWNRRTILIRWNKLGVSKLWKVKINRSFRRLERLFVHFTIFTSFSILCPFFYTIVHYKQKNEVIFTQVRRIWIPSFLFNGLFHCSVGNVTRGTQARITGRSWWRITNLGVTTLPCVFQSSSIYEATAWVLDIDRVARATTKRAKTIGEKRVHTQLTPVPNRRVIRANWFARQRTKDR